MRVFAIVILSLLVGLSYADFTYSSFNDTNSLDFNLIGAAIYDPTEASLQLVQSTRTRIGAAFHVNTDGTGEYVAPGFITQFTFMLSQTVGNGGAGIAFVLQPNNSYVVGTSGAGIGYGDQGNGQAGIPNSLAIELDTFLDSTMNDPNNNHCGVHSRGNTPNSSNEQFVVDSLVNSTIPALQNGTNSITHDVYIEYQAATSYLSVIIDGIQVLISNNFKVTDYILLDPATGESFIGITSSTNPSDYFEVDILSWDFWQGNGTIVPSATEIYGPGYDAAIYGQDNIYYIQLVDNYGYNLTQPGSAQGVNPTCALAYGTDITNLTSIVCTPVYLQEGLYEATYFMNEVGVFTLITTVSTYVNTTLLTVTGPPYAPLTVASGAGLSSAVAGIASTFTITTYDSSGALSTDAASFSITLTLTSNTSVVVTGSASNPDGSGTYTATYTVTIAGTYTLAVVLLGGAPNGGPIKSSPFTVVAVPGNFSAANSYAFGPGIVSGVAGQVSFFYVQAVDAFGNNATSPIRWVITSTLPTKPLQLGSTSTTLLGSNGLSNNTYVQTTAGNFPLSVTDDNNNPIKLSPFTVSISPYLAYPGTSVASGAALTTGTAGVLESFQIQPYDQYNNKVADPNLVFNVTLIGATISYTATVVYNSSSSEYVATYNATVAGTYNLLIDLISGGAATGPIASSPFALTINPGPVYVPLCYAYGQGLSSAQVGITANFTIQSVDAYNNTITTLQAAVFTVTFDPSFNGTVNPVIANNDGTYFASYVGYKTGTFQLSVTSGSQSIKSSPFTVGITSGPAFAPASFANGTGYTNGVAGQISTFTIQSYDAYGNPITSNGGPCTGSLSDNSGNTFPLTCSYASGNFYDASYNVTLAGSYNITVFINGQQIQNSPAVTVVVPGPIYALGCTAVGPGLSSATAGVTANFNITARDQFGNEIDDGSFQFSVFLTSVSGNSSFGFVTYSGVGGLYYATYTLYSPAGSWSLIVSYGETSISGSPFAVTLIPGPASTLSYVYPTIAPSTLQNVTAYEQSTFYIQGVDAYGNNVTTGGANFTADFIYGGAAVLTVKSNYNSNGIYFVNYVLQQSGTYSVSVTVGTQQISNSPLALYVAPGLPAANFTYAYGTPNGLGLDYAIAGDNTTFTIVTVDLGGSDYPFGGATFNFSLWYTADANITGQVYYTDNNNGTYTCTYNVTKAGDWTLIIILASGPVGYQGQIKDSPFNPVVYPGQNCPENAEVLELALAITVNATNFFQIQSRDCYGNIVSASNVYYDVLVQGPDCSFGNSVYWQAGIFNVTYIVIENGNYSIFINERGVPIAGSPFAVVATGGEEVVVESNLSSTSLVFMWLMIVFIILYVIFCLLLIGFVIFTQRKQLQKSFGSNYQKIHSDSSSSSSSD